MAHGINIISKIKMSDNEIYEIHDKEATHKSDIINNLESNISNKPLSAAQGVLLKSLIDAIVIPTKVSAFENDSGYLTVSNIPFVLATEEWNFGLEDGSIITKTIVTTDSITNEELTFELEDGTIITKKVVIQ